MKKFMIVMIIVGLWPFNLAMAEEQRFSLLNGKNRQNLIEEEKQSYVVAQNKELGGFSDDEIGASSSRNGQPSNSDNSGSEDNTLVKNWNVSVGYKLWFNKWQTWTNSTRGLTTNSPGHFITTTSEATFLSIPSLTYKYKDFSISGSFLPKRSFHFPQTSSLSCCSKINEEQPPVPVEIQSDMLAERKEWDISFSYSILDNLSVGASLKKVEMDYTFTEAFVYPIEFTTGGEVSLIDRLPNLRVSKTKVKMSGPALNIAGSVPLLNKPFGSLGLYGNFSYGAMKTKYQSGNTDYTPYYLTEVGLSYTYPFKEEDYVRYSAMVGYRTQTFYTESPTNDAVDMTEGFVLGVVLTF